MAMQCFEQESMELIDDRIIRWQSLDERLEYLSVEELGYLIGVPRGCRYVKLTQVPCFDGVIIELEANIHLLHWFLVEFTRKKTAHRFVFDLDEYDFPIFEEDPTLVVNLKTDNSPMGEGKDQFRYFGLCPAPYDVLQEKYEKARDHVGDFLEGVKHVKGDAFYDMPPDAVYNLYVECMTQQGKSPIEKEKFLVRLGQPSELKEVEEMASWQSF